MITLAGRLGVNTQNSLAFDACIRALYKMLYLNIDNLWIGDGLVNQMIGFLATPFSEYGQDLARKEIVFNKKKEHGDKQGGQKIEGFAILDLQNA